MGKRVAEAVLILCIIIAEVITVSVVADVAIAFWSLVGPEKNYDVRDPTYQEAIQFICSDQTDKNQYNESYTCVNFANDFRNNALNEGYRCGYVSIEFPEDRHAMVCFNTSDNGLVFIEPQSDEIVALTTEQQYLGREILRFSTIW